MFELTVKRRFAAAHKLEGYGGKCASLHGHTWTVEVRVKGERLDECGMLVDFIILKDIIDGIIRQLDHTYLNELECFNGAGGKINPTAENLAAYIYRRVGEELAKIAPGVLPCGVRIWESPDASALYLED
ncbi:MAG: 6-carboxytetrahydropterin synthase QueD [Bacillota bacterium]